MLSLQINGEAVDLLPGASITIEEESPVFEKDSIPGGYSYPFSLPITPRNRRILGFPDRIGNPGAMSVTQPFRLFHNGHQIFSGTVTVSESSDLFKAYLLVSTGDLASKIGDKKLRDINFGGRRTWQWKNEYRYPEDDFTLAPVFNAKFYEGSPFASEFNAFKNRINAYENGTFDLTSRVDLFVTSPFPFLNFVVKQIFTENGFSIVSNVLETDPDFRDLVVFTLRDIGSWQYNFQVDHVLIGYDAVGAPIYEDIQVGNVADRVINPFDLADCMPDISVADFLKSLRNLLNISFIISGDTVRIVRRQDLLQARPGKDITLLASRPISITRQSVNGFKLDWLQEGEDVLWGSEFFTRIEEVLDFVRDPVETVADLAALQPAPNEIRYVAEVDLYFRWIHFQFDPQDETLYRWQWVAWSYNYQAYRSGAGEDVFTAKVAPILMANGFHDNTQTGIMRMPLLEQTGNYPAKTEDTPFQFRLIFYRGMAKDSLGNDYPYATNDNLDRSGNPLPGKRLALRWDGEFGLFNQLWRGYLDWWCNKKVIKLSITDPSDLDFACKYTIDGQHYLLKNRTINLSSRGVEPGECEFYLI